MKTKTLILLFSACIILSACNDEENLRLQSELTTIKTQIATCKAGAQAAYEANTSFTSFLTQNSDRAKNFANEMAEHNRNSSFWKCMNAASPQG